MFVLNNLQDPAVVGNQGMVVIETKMATEMTTSEAVGTSMAAVTLEETKGTSSQVKLGAMRGKMEKLTGKFIKMGDKELLLLAMMKVKVKADVAVETQHPIPKFILPFATLALAVVNPISSATWF
ncbi:hypothetical protein Gotri_000794 [Gossypium trilobum]|uniref:Uncharacterized protein n=1 Tax=Gossypium trilobum TaxID=34281 RepID=A0A7J9FEJ5_9ROSI|nr:hypothetical protein [Gossypium trilobum]